VVQVIIQIPCFNEEATLGVTLADLPTALPGVDRVELLVIDDGSTDGTVDVAQRQGVHHILRQPHNQGLARAYMAGLQFALSRGTDIIVNTDADNQYCGADIAKLVEAIVANKADVVIGARPITEIDHFSPTKKLLQLVGSWVLRRLSGVDVADAASGFRAVNREAAKRLVVYNRYTYTLETLIQAGQQNMRVMSVPIRVNAELRPSKLVKNNLDYMVRGAVTMVRVYIIYKPLRFFAIIAAVLFVPGLAATLRFLYLFATGDGAGHVQSLLLGTSMIGVAVVLLVAGILADLVSVNRRLLEDLRVRIFDLPHGQAGGRGDG